MKHIHTNETKPNQTESLDTNKISISSIVLAIIQGEKMCIHIFILHSNSIQFNSIHVYLRAIT
jgi:polynucleotide 5'-kinase involved in rRNA processing